MRYVTAHTLASLGLEISLMSVHYFGLVSLPLSLHSFNYYPFHYKVLSHFGSVKD